MQTIIHVLCKKGDSLRDIIAKDSKIDVYGLDLTEFKNQNRAHGWAKIKSSGTPGALNLKWDASSQTLICRAVTKLNNIPEVIVGSFVAYLLARHGKRIVSIVISQIK